MGGKFGASLEADFGAKFMGDLLKFTQAEFVKKYGDKSGFVLRVFTQENLSIIFRDLSGLFDPVTAAGSTIYVVDRRTKP